MGTGDTWTNAIVGAAVTLGLSFTGFSALLGGGVAGYLQAEPPRRGARVGAISGAIAVVPLFLLVLVGFGLFAAGAGSVGVPGGLEMLVIALVALPTLGLWFVGLSAAGGYVGAHLAERSG